MLKIKARARVQLTIDIPVSDTWGDDCTTGQIHKQAIESAINMLSNRKYINHPVLVEGGGSCLLVGQPRVTMILLDEVD